jgi:dihydroorotate dehydrogenase electron transfer subunit
MKLLSAEIINIQRVNEDVYKMELQFEEPFNCLPGQFVNIRISTLDVPLLRRPISISRQINNRVIELMIREIGIGTKLLKEKIVGEKIDLLGPLGNGFDLTGVNEESRILIVGGGIGIAPLRGLHKAIEEIKVKKVTVVSGFREKPYAKEDFQGAEYHEIDESKMNLFVTQYIEKELVMADYDQVFTCGPHPMMIKMKSLCENSNTALQVSLEEKMACGIGVCLGCAVKIKTNDFDYTYKKVCVDGPVFDSREVIFDE